MTDLVKDLFDLPAHVAGSDFVLSLTSGVQAPERTAATYVVTEALQDAFDRSLRLIGSALADGRSKPAYVHGSFGSGKSHFMAVLSLLIDGNEAVWKIAALHPLREKHSFIGHKKLLQLRYHMIGATTFEEKVLGEYVRFVQKHHPDAPLPPVFADEELFDNARHVMVNVGEEKFFETLGGKKKGWGALAQGWTRERFELHATSSNPGLRAELFAALVATWFPAYIDSGRYVDIDTGLTALTRHARELGYDGVVLYLDELILWLSHRASEKEWLHNEVQKMVKLVESQEATRAVPIVSFIARQRNLAEMVGKMHTGIENQLLHESLQHWEGRFDRINLEDRDLPRIVEKRVLKPKNDAARAEVDAAFDKLRATAGKSFDTLLGKADAAAFRKLYPFTPALVSSLVALSNSLQRERTAIKLLLELLVEHIPDLAVGEVVRVGDLFDVLVGGDEPADGIMAARFKSAKDLYKQQLLPMLQETNGTQNRERCQRERESHPVRLGCSGCGEKQCRVDNRIVKTLLIAALVPEVDELKNLTVGQLYRLNHGMVKSMIPGQEAGIVAGKIRKWATSIAQIRIGNESDPSVSVRLEGVDLKPIFDRYSGEDTPGLRQRGLREVLFEGLGLDAVNADQKELAVTWKGTKRTGKIWFTNVRTAPAERLRCQEDHDFLLVVDYPFDDPGRSPREDVEAAERFRETGGSWTLVWLPDFFSNKLTQLLGELVILEHILSDKRVQREAVQHLTLENQTRAINDMENLRAQKRNRLLEAIAQAYGLATPDDETLDSANTVESHLLVLKHGVPALRPELAANLANAKDAYIDALLFARYPRHPDFTKPLTARRVNELVDTFADLVNTEEGRLPVDREMRAELVGTLGALDLVRFSETHVLKHEESRLQPLENKRLQKGAERPTVGELRGFIDEGRKMGLQTNALDLVVRCYAVWARRTLELDGKPLEPAKLKGDLPDRAVLEKPELPTQQEWNDAFAKAGQCFGLTFAGKHLSPDNLGRFRASLEEKLQGVAGSCAEATGLLERRAAELHLEADSDRVTTSQSAERAVMAVRGKSGVEQVRALAGFEPKTSGTAVGRHVGRAAELVAVLKDDLVFGSFLQLARRMDEVPGAHEVLDEVGAAFRQDELHVQLAPRLRELARRAQTLLTGPAPEPSTGRVLASVRAQAAGKDEVRRRLAGMVSELEAALDRAEGDVELSGTLTLKER